VGVLIPAQRRTIGKWREKIRPRDTPGNGQSVRATRSRAAISRTTKSSLEPGRVPATKGLADVLLTYDSWILLHSAYLLLGVQEVAGRPGCSDRTPRWLRSNSANLVVVHRPAELVLLLERLAFFDDELVLRSSRRHIGHEGCRAVAESCGNSGCSVRVLAEFARLGDVMTGSSVVGGCMVDFGELPDSRGATGAARSQQPRYTTENPRKANTMLSPLPLTVPLVFSRRRKL